MIIVIFIVLIIIICTFQSYRNSMMTRNERYIWYQRHMAIMVGLVASLEITFAIWFISLIVGALYLMMYCTFCLAIIVVLIFIWGIADVFMLKWWLKDEK